MTRWNFNSLITLSALRRQQSVRRRSWRCHLYVRRVIQILRCKDACFLGGVFFSPGVLWRFRLHLCMRWWVCVTAHFTMRTSSLSCISFSSIRVTSDHRETYVSVSCTSEIKPSNLLALMLNSHPKPSTFNCILTPTAWKMTNLSITANCLDRPHKFSILVHLSQGLSIHTYFFCTVCLIVVYRNASMLY